ncbi:hypothetical protein [Chitinolyticbacter meiyuanensis]|uniref:hypothetical protein n=1 Tax=Chitinolyticbacter meiyuanensis TaxID=682798 RepID=UPI0011E5AC7C|nr:hypothetical protein [Chitinolyticbacter meiyuanensis]
MKRALKWMLVCLCAWPLLARAGNDPCAELSRYFARGMEALAEAKVPQHEEHDGMLITAALELNEQEVADLRAQLLVAGKPLVLGALDPAKTVALLQRAAEPPAVGVGRTVVFVGPAADWPSAQVALRQLGTRSIFADIAIAPRAADRLECRW